MHTKAFCEKKSKEKEETKKRKKMKHEGEEKIKPILSKGKRTNLDL